MSQSNEQEINDNWLKEQLSRIEKCSELKYNWNGMESDPPNTWAMEWMEKIIRFQHKIGFCKGVVSPDGEGGITVCIQEEKKYADISVLNCGEILPLTDDSVERAKCWNVETNNKAVKTAVNHIRTFLEESAK